MASHERSYCAVGETKGSTPGTNLSIDIRPRLLSALVEFFNSSVMMHVGGKRPMRHYYAPYAAPAPSLRSLSLDVPHCVVDSLGHQETQA